jgi:tRNA A-37 threonylcarbamoyl transferase component Bud32
VDRIGRFEIVRELGRGAMGIVYHAVDPNIGRAVAIKTIRLSDIRNNKEQTKLRDRLFREARSAGSLSHPGIVTIYDVDQEGDTSYIAMEFVDGPTLDDVMSGDEPLTGAQVFGVLGQTAVALDYAHSKGIVHRDVKPANIMIAPGGAAKITDFGIAKINAAEQFTLTGAIVGTPHYMSPEQVQGKPVDGRSDQFSLAVIAFEMLTGEKPFAGEHLTAMVFKIVAEPPPSARRINPSLTPAIEAALLRGLAKKPEQRFATCSEFVDGLEKACAASPGWKALARGGCLEAVTVADGPPVAPLAPPKRTRRRTATTAETTAPKRTGFGSFLAAVLVAAGLLALIGWQAAPWLQQSACTQSSAPKTAAEKPPEPQPVVPPVTAPPLALEDKKPSPLAAVNPPPPAGSTEPVAPAVDEPKPAPPDAPKPGAAKPTEVRAAAPRPRVAAKAGPISLISSPAGAAVTLDGQPGTACLTPCSLEAPLGRHSVSFTLAGYGVEHREITVTGNPQETSMVTLRPLGGTLMLTSSPSGAAVTINGKRWSQPTPAQISLAPGTYTVQIEKDGRQSSRSVEVRNGVINYLKITIE